MAGSLVLTGMKMRNVDLSGVTANSELASPVNDNKDTTLFNKGTLTQLALDIYNKHSTSLTKPHNFNRSDGSARTFDTLRRRVHETDVATSGNISKLLLLQHSTEPFEPCRIDLKRFDLHETGVGMDWSTSTYVVYAWMFSGTYKNFYDYYVYITTDENVSVSMSLKIKIRSFLATNSKYRNDLKTILYFNYIGETTNTGEFRGSTNPGQHRSPEGGGSKVLAGIFSTFQGFLTFDHSLLYVTSQNTSNLDEIDVILQDEIKFVEALFATLCGRVIMNVMNCGWFFRGIAWWWRLYAYVLARSHKKNSDPRVWTSNDTCGAVITGDEGLMCILESKGIGPNATIQQAWECTRYDAQQASMAAYNDAGVQFGMGQWDIILLLSKHPGVEKGMSLLIRLTSIVKGYGNEIEAVMDAVFQIRSEHSRANIANHHRSIALARKGTGLSHGAVRFILRLHRDVFPGGKPIERLVYILENIYGNNLDNVFHVMKQKGRSEKGYQLSSSTNNKTSSSSSTNNKTSSTSFSSTTSTTSTTSTNNKTSSLEDELSDEWSDDEGSDDEGSGDKGTGDKGTQDEDGEFSIGELWNMYCLVSGEGDDEKSSAAYCKWSLKYFNNLEQQRKDNEQQRKDNLTRRYPPVLIKGRGDRIGSPLQSDV